MREPKQYVAIDLGAESGRAMLATLEGDTLDLADIHRFPNGPIEEHGTLRWDFPRLIGEAKRGLALCAERASGEIAGIGVDSWGVDFGLLDAHGNLIENPYHYRDSRTDGMLEEASRRMPRRELYKSTGIQFMQLNSLYQLLAMRVKRDPALDRAHRLVMIADLVSCFLCGRAFAEYTLASTSQLMDMHTGKWSEALLSAMDMPRDILPDVVAPGTVVGALTDEVAAETGCGPVPVIAVASHDTGCAVAAVPAQGDNWAYLSSGTWSLLGVETPAPVINDKTFEYAFTNEGGVEGTIRLLKNIMGLWIVQECRRQWQREGDDLSYPELTALAERAKPFAARILPDHADFLAPGDMPAKINNYLSATGQDTLADRGEIVRTVLESLAFTYSRTLDRMADVVGRDLTTLHIVGGGTQNELLSQFAANATQRTVITGPIEATAVGNVLMQAMALGHIDSLPALRSIVRNTFPTRQFTPQHQDTWEQQYRQWLKHAN